MWEKFSSLPKKDAILTVIVHFILKELNYALDSTQTQHIIEYATQALNILAIILAKKVEIILECLQPILMYS